jgi:hypothetical protein
VPVAVVDVVAAAGDMAVVAVAVAADAVATVVVAADAAAIAETEAAIAVIVGKRALQVAKQLSSESG